MNYAVVELLQHVPDYMKLVQKNEIEIVYQLLGHGMISRNKFLSDDVMLPLAFACEKVHLQMAKLLWVLGAFAKPELKTQILPLQAAIRGGRVEVVRWLLDEVLV